MIQIQNNKIIPIKTPIACIVVPHPDDFEIFTGHTAQYFIKRGFKVIEILMTGGEYGIVNRFRENGEHLKGLPLRKIRARENLNAKAVYDQVTFPPNQKKRLHKPYVTSIAMGYVDGYLPFSKESFEDLLRILKEIQPDVIVGAEPVFSIDWHRDHMATAYLTFFAIKHLISTHADYLPKKYFLYQSFDPNCAFPLQSWEIYKQSCLNHRSQLSPLSVRRMGAVISFYRKIFTKNCNKLREISTKNLDSFNKTTGKITSIRNSLLLSIFHKPRTKNPLYNPTPEELGFSRFPERLMTKNDK
jgi:LmbE family N-acetylglucosaminyl deacetylase